MKKLPGELAGRGELIDFIAMLKVFESRLRSLVDQGLSLEEIVAAEPLRDYEETAFPAANFIRLAVEEMRGSAE